MNDWSGPSGERKQKNRTGDRFHDVPFGSKRPEPAGIITRVQIHALISGEISAPSMGTELLNRLTYLCAASGRRLHSLQVEFVPMPVACPGCGQHAMHRCARKGLMQTKFYPLFGLYPWICTCCRRTRLLKLRQAPKPAHMSPETVEADAHARAA